MNAPPKGSPGRRTTGGTPAPAVTLKPGANKVANRFPALSPNSTKNPRQAQPSIVSLLSKSGGQSRIPKGSVPKNPALTPQDHRFGPTRSPRLGRPAQLSSRLLTSDRKASLTLQRTDTPLLEKTGKAKPGGEGPGPSGEKLGDGKAPALTPRNPRVRDPLMVAMMKAKSNNAKDTWAGEKAAGGKGGAAPLGRFSVKQATEAASKAEAEGGRRMSLTSGQQRSPFAAPVGESTEESLNRVRHRHRAKKRMPKKLTEVEVDMIVEELKKRRQKVTDEEKHLNKGKVSRLLQLPDDELLDVMMSVREQRYVDEARDPRPRNRISGAGPGPPLATEAPESPTGTKFLPAVWSLPHGKIKAPGVYMDDNLLKTGAPTHPVHAAKALLATGPFGVGEAKACLDDLQAHLLSYYGKLFKIEPNLPLEWQLEQLSRNYYPSPAPISGNTLNPLTNGRPLEPGVLPPPREPVGPLSIAADSPPDRRDESKTQFPKLKKIEEREDEAQSGRRRSKTGSGAKLADDAPGKAPDTPLKATADDPSATLNGIPLPGQPEGMTKTATLPTVKRDVSGVMAELFDLAKGNGDRLTTMMKEIDGEIGDGTSRNFWHSDQMRRDGLSCPKYLSDAPCVEYLGDLEASVETMYRNLRITAEWNNRKIKLMEDRLKVLKQANDRRSGL